MQETVGNWVWKNASTSRGMSSKTRVLANTQDASDWRTWHTLDAGQHPGLVVSVCQGQALMSAGGLAVQ